MKIVNKFIFIFPLIILSPCIVNGQSSIRDSSINMGFASFNFAYSFPYADMEQRFGNNSSLGISGGFKHKSNFFVEASISFLFGMEVKEDGILDYLKSSKGYLISSQGTLQPVSLEERGSLYLVNIGKLFSVVGPNPNSGFFIKAGLGFIQHRILFGYSKTLVNLPMLEGNYLKGYDRLTNGIALHQSIGYQYFSNRNLGNFHLSFDIIEGFTQNRRSWNFDEFGMDGRKRLDILAGFRVGIDIPLYARVPDDFYIN